MRKLRVFFECKGLPESDLTVSREVNLSNEGFDVGQCGGVREKIHNDLGSNEVGARGDRSKCL